MYTYAEQRKNIFTEDGQVTFLKIRDNVQCLLKQAGSVRMEEAINGVYGDTWTMLACVDRLVELGEIREITKQGEVAGQHRVFVSTGFGS